MSRSSHTSTLTRIAVVIVCVLAAILVTVSLQQKSNHASEHRNEAVPAKSERAEKTLSPVDAGKELERLITAKANSQCTYQDIVRLARGLTDEKLLALLDKTYYSPSSHQLWTRCALYHEWAGRDLEAALAYLKKRRKYNRGDPELYAIFTGSRPQDPEQALLYLRSLPDDPRYKLSSSPSLANHIRPWVKHANRRILAELSSVDPELAWRYLPGRDREEGTKLDHNEMASRTHTYPSMVHGFFSGLPDAATVEAYVERFGPVGDFRVSKSIAQAWMEHDLQAALDWIPPQARRYNMPNVPPIDGPALADWARAQPREALRVVGEDSSPEWTPTIASNLLRGDARLAPELVAILSDRPVVEGQRPVISQVLGSSLLVYGTTHLAGVTPNDYFPELDRDNPPVDYALRHQFYVDALEHESFSADERASLRLSLDHRFQIHWGVIVP